MFLYMCEKFFLLYRILELIGLIYTYNENTRINIYNILFRFHLRIINVRIKIT